MKYTTNSIGIFTRYDLSEETQYKIRTISENPIFQTIVIYVVDGDEEQVELAVNQALNSENPQKIIYQGLIPGIKEVARMCEAGAYFLPQVILAADAMVTGISLCEKKMGKAIEKKAKVVTHTAEGDIHDIGQVIINALLNAAGFEVINLGGDVLVDKVVEACRIHNPIMLTGTALMTTTMSAFPKIAAKLKELKIEVPFVCGGGAVNEEYVTSFDLGIWGKEAHWAPAMAQDALGGMNWKEMRAKWNG